MALRTSWKGFIKLSLVSVPVKGYTANNTSSGIRLNQLHKDCNNRINYKKSCPEHGELTSDSIVKGYEYGKGQYVVIDESELDKLRTKNDHSVNIAGFIDPTQIDSIYHAGRTYYLLPDGAVGQKPYALLLRGMVDNNVNALAQVVIAGREQLVLLRPSDDPTVLAMTILNHHGEVKKAESFKDEIEETQLTDEELALTKTLIQASGVKDFDFSKYSDTYVAKLKELIQTKVEGKEIVQVADPEEPKIINLMDALKKSVAEAQAAGSSGGSKKQTAGGKKLAPSQGTERARKKKVG